MTTNEFKTYSKRCEIKSDWALEILKSLGDMLAYVPVCEYSYVPLLRLLKAYQAFQLLFLRIY